MKNGAREKQLAYQRQRKMAAALAYRIEKYQLS